jgi:quercetin dioxygenase-like cupin family protein
MTNPVPTAILFSVIGAAAIAWGGPGKQGGDQGTSGISIQRQGSQPATPGRPENFTGSAMVTPLFQATQATRAAGASVTFQPGARTAWHSHPAGQTLIVTSGNGWVQQAGGPKQEIKAGDVVWTPPGVKHWHGATISQAMTHIAIQEHVNGKVVDWQEHVTEEQYRR